MRQSCGRGQGTRVWCVGDGVGVQSICGSKRPGHAGLVLLFWCLGHVALALRLLRPAQQPGSATALLPDCMMAAALQGGSRAASHVGMYVAKCAA